MTLKGLIHAVATAAGQTRDSGHISKADTEAVLRALGQVAATELGTEGGEIPLPGIGRLKASTRAGRTGRNPATGQEIQIPAKRTVKISLSRDLVDAIN